MLQVQDAKTAYMPVSEQAIVQYQPQEILVELVRRNPEQPRVEFEQQAMDELVESVRQYGVLIPVLVEYDPLTSGYVLQDGERRLRAAKAAGWTTIPARIMPAASDETRLVHALVANLHNESMTIVEHAQAYRRLMENYGYGARERVARLLGISPVKVGNALTVLKLPEHIQTHFARRKLPNDPNVVRAFLKITDSGAQRKLADKLAGLPHPPTAQQCRMACTRLVNLLSAQSGRTQGPGQNAMRFAGLQHGPKEQWPEWDALYQLGRVPAWPVVNDAVMVTCDACAMRPVAGEATCRECALVDCLRRLLKAVNK